jgi:hypothetical protein
MKESDYLGGLGVDGLLKLNWILWKNGGRAHVIDQEWTLVNMVMNLWVPSAAGNFLNS